MTNRNDRTLLVLMIISMVIWGGTWPSAKAVAGSLPTEVLTFWRFCISTVTFVPIMIAMRVPFRVGRPAIPPLLLGILSMSVYFFLFLKGLRYGHAGAAGVLVTSLIPFATLVVTTLFLGRPFRRIDIIGTVLGVTGCGIVLRVWEFDATQLLASGNAYFLLCPPLWAVVTVASQLAGRHLHPVTYSFHVHLACTAIYLVAATPGAIAGAFGQDAAFWGNMLYLGTVSSVFATTVYFHASSRLDSYRASSFVFIVPTSALVISWLLLGEQPLPSTIAGGIVAVAATWLVNRRVPSC